MRVVGAKPGIRGRWSVFAFGFLGDGNTCGFLHPPCTSHRSMRLFLERFLAADNEPLPNDQTGISIGISAHLTLLTEAKRCARAIAFDGLPLGIANDQAMAASAFSGRIAGVHPAGNHPQVPCLVFGEVEDPPLHPEGTLAIPPVAILAFCRLEVPQVLEDQHIAHLVSARIVQFACEQGASMLVFEHLGNLKPAKGKYSHRGNSKRAFWMKGRIFHFAKYKAWNLGMITSRVNPRNTSRECARCHSLIVRYAQGQPVEGYSPVTPLCLCQQCQMRGNADRNASLIIGQRLIARSQKPFKEKPRAPVRRAGRVEKSTGVARSQDAKRKKGPSLSDAWHGDDNAHGTAQE